MFLGKLDKTVTRRNLPSNLRTATAAKHVGNSGVFRVIPQKVFDDGGRSREIIVPKVCRFETALHSFTGRVTAYAVLIDFSCGGKRPVAKQLFSIRADTALRRIKF